MSVFNKLVVASLPIIPKSIIRLVAQRYIAGPHLVDAVRVTKDLMARGAASTIDVLGEFVSSRERAEHETVMQASVIDAIHTNKLSSYLSVKPTSLGLDIDHDFAYANISGLVQKAASLGVFVRMDMENTPYTDITLDFYRRLRKEGHNNVGVVIQAYLRRSEADIRSLLDFEPSVRLCKGIYVESEEHAFKDPNEVRANYRSLLRILLDGRGRTHIATHDESLIVDAEKTLADMHVARERYEFQMLLGVREDRRDILLRNGHAVRIYVPFGEDWYGYSTRRLKENPQVAGYVAKAVLTGK
ncbi:MAG: proline dehydrogenase family protein [Ignavibacteria bacterium]|nr:proline dehydrogenase family protein [Ignavibacteria bacterium]MBP6509184.1 proline dehydrogenase family protein [Candidatus Kapabacteria bacterium]MBK6419614.1 proline dehydrogenase family protein [Ignavibacteria bacterium]MBK6759763.1 proline dehydrogenase family protein [Ignavibacteria bacterium]MBK7184647.1 proline dehydrogenase family protein [Ignavibacteria bacterium]